MSINRKKEVKHAVGRLFHPSFQKSVLIIYTYATRNTTFPLIFLLFCQIFLPSRMPGCRRNLDSAPKENKMKMVRVLKIQFLTSTKISVTQSPDFYGILASRMVGRFGRKVGRSGKSLCFLSHSFRFAEDISKQQDKKTYLPHVLLLLSLFQL